jgi:hypothetical protein
MLPRLLLPSVYRTFLHLPLMLVVSLLPAEAQTRDGPPVPQQPPVTSRGGDIPATQNPPSKNEGHGTETNPGRVRIARPAWGSAWIRLRSSTCFGAMMIRRSR